MPSWLDLSVPVVTGMPVYPGAPAVEVSPALRAPRDGVNVLRLHLGSQSGTHVDAPYHVDDAWPRLDELPLDRFAGRAVVADVRGLPARAPITPGLPAPALGRLRQERGLTLVLVTGWSVHWGNRRLPRPPLAHPRGGRGRRRGGCPQGRGRRPQCRPHASTRCRTGRLRAARPPCAVRCGRRDRREPHGS